MLDKFSDILKNPYFLAVSFILAVFLITHVSYLKFIIFFCLIPIFLLVINFDFKKAFIFSFSAFFMSYLLSFTWLLRYNLKTFVLGGFSFILPFVLLVLIIFLYKHLFYKKINNKLFFSILALLFPVLWLLFFVVFEKLGFFSFWMNLAMFFPLSAPLIWIIKSEGITFLIVLFNSLIALLLSKKVQKIFLIFFGFLFSFFLFCFLFSVFSVPANEKPADIAVVQGVANYSWDYRFKNSDSILQMYRDLTLSINESVDIIVWPEYSISKDPTKDEFFIMSLLDISNKTNASIILGVPVFKNDEFSYFSPRYDTALFINENEFELIYSEKVAPYESNVLVVEDGSRIFYNDNLKIGVLLCWEETQPNIIRRLVKENPDLIVSLANDQRFDNTAGIYLSSLFSRIAAAENRVFWIRATNTGMSQIINPNGKITAKLPVLKRKILIYKI